MKIVSVAAIGAAALVVAACASGGSAASGDGGAAPPQSGAAANSEAGDPQAAESLKSAAAAAAGDTADTADVKNKFMPVLKAEYAKVTWPQARTMSAERIWTILSPRAADTNLTVVDAKSAVGVWVTCAWTLQLVDDTKAGKDTAADVAGLKKAQAYDQDIAPVTGKIISEADLGVITTARQFVTANECSKGFSS